MASEQNEVPDDEVTEALAEQTPVKVRISKVRLSTGYEYLDLTAKKDKANLLDAVALLRRIKDQSDVQTTVYQAAMLAENQVADLAYEYELMERPKADK